MRKKIFTFLLALTASIGMMWAETVVVINKSEFTSSGVTKEGVTLALSNGSMTSSDVLAMDGSFEFSTSLGKFTGITIETDANIMQIYEGAYTSAGWPTGQNLGTSAVWTGESETVLISCMVAGMNTITITCTIEPAPTTEDPAGPIVIATNTGQSSYTQGSITVSVGEVGDGDGFYLNDDKPASISNSGSSTISKIELVPGWFLNKHSYVRANGAEPNSSSEELITFLNVNSNEVTISCSVAIYIKEVRIYFEEPAPAPAGNVKLIEFQVPASWENDNTPISSADFPDFVATTYEIASALPVTSEPSLVIFNFPEVDEVSVYTKVGGQVSQPSTGAIKRESFFENTQVHYYYPVLDGDEPQPQIGPKEVLDLGTTGCVGEHYQLTGGGTNTYRTVGGVDDKMITIESLHGEIIDNISLKLYYYNVWTGYSVAASSGDVSSWNYDAYEDLVITNINATSVTLSRVGSGQENGYVMFEKVTINNSDEPQPQPAEDVNITPNVDPDHAGVYYSTFFDSANKYALPAGVEAYVADLSGANLLLTKIAEAGQTIPANVAVILKSSVDQFTLTVSDADAVTFTATNDLQGSDDAITAPTNCYVLAGNDGVGFYHYTASMLNPHKAYVIYSGSQAPRRMPFIFDQATGVESVQPSAISSQKVIENGQLFIIKNGVKYNAQGQVVK